MAGSKQDQNQDPSQQFKISSFFQAKEECLNDESAQLIQSATTSGGGEVVVICPICERDIAYLSESLRTAHVTYCLDGQPETSQVVKKQVVKKRKLANLSGDDQPDLGTSNSASDPAQAQAATAQKRAKPAVVKPNMPFYKVFDINNRKVAVDAFCYGTIPGVTAYFLTHFHSDHYGGLSKSWNSGPIYCTKATSRLCQMNLQVDPAQFVEIPLNEWTGVFQGIEVLFLDANHCPGSAIILFKSVDKTILHTGDFRASPDHISRLQSTYLDTVYLDTTYLSPSHKFPAQQDVIRACGEYVVQLRDAGASSSFLTATIDRFFATKRRNGDGAAEYRTQLKHKNYPLVLVGTYTIGKERVAIHIANKLETKIFAQRNKKRVLAAIEDPELDSLLDDDGWESAVHLVSMRDLTWDRLETYFKPLSKEYSHCLAFMPTGWNYRPGNKNQQIEAPQFTVRDLTKCRSVKGKIHMFRVPYSEHSSFTELQTFCSSLKIGRVIPTVNTHSAEHRDMMQRHIDQWLDKY